MTKLQIGDVAPDFTLATDKGVDFALSGAIGHPVVLVFYPEDDTEGCTVENIEFTLLMPEFSALGAEVVGISPNSVADHCKFRDKYSLGILLAADPDHMAIDAYGVWGDKKTFGNEYEGLIRTSFVIDSAGLVAGIFTVTRVKGHAKDVLVAVRALPA